MTIKLALLAIVAAAVGCNSKTCGGIATCYGDQAAQCQKIPGCSPTPGCVVSPAIGLDCAAELTEADCRTNVLPDGCTWTNGKCVGPCNAATTMATCQDMPECRWSACTGAPKTCDHYSADSCPASPLGCYVTSEQNGRIFE